MGLVSLSFIIPGMGLVSLSFIILEHLTKWGWCRSVVLFRST